MDAVFAFGICVIISLVAGCFYYDEMQGISSNSYWNEPKPNLRDELFLIVNTMFSLINLTRKIKPNNDWLIDYEVAFLIQSKTFSQNILSIDKLA